MWDAGPLVEVAIRLVVIANISVDFANGVTSATTLPVVGFPVLATIIVGCRSAAPAPTAA